MKFKSNLLNSLLRATKVSLLAGMVAFAAQSANADVSQNFDATFFPVPPANNAAGFQNNAAPQPQVITGWDGNAFRLATDGTANAQNILHLNQQFSGGWSTLRYDFQMKIGGVGGNADGFGMALLNVANHGADTYTTPGYFSEEPNVVGSFAVGFDTHPSGGIDNNAPDNSVSLHLNNSLVASQTTNIGAGNDFFIESNNVLNATVLLQTVPGGSNVTVLLTDTVTTATIFPFDEFFVAGLNPYDHRLAFTSRTGGLDSDQDIDNITQNVNAGGTVVVENFESYALGTLPPQPTPTPPVLNGPSFFTHQQNSGVTPSSLMPGDAGSDGDFYRLTHDEGSQNQTIAFGHEASQFSQLETSISFDYRMPVDAGHTGCCGERADGFGLLLLNTNTYGLTGALTAAPQYERPNLVDALGLGFDIFDGGTGPNGNTISIWYGGVQLAESIRTDFELNNGVFNNVRVELIEDGADVLMSVFMTLDINGAPGSEIQIFDNVLISGIDLNDQRLAFGGRTGGAFTSIDLDNVNMTSIPEPGTVAMMLLGLGAFASRRQRA